MGTYAGRYSEDLQDRYGNGFRNAKVAVQTLAGAAVTLYADRGKTAYVPASGLAANEIKADNKGNLQFFADPGNYQIVVTPTGQAALTAHPVSVFKDPFELTISLGRTWYDASSYASVGAAITAAGVGGGIAFRPATTYQLTSTLTPLTDQHFKGGTGTILKIADGAVINIFSITNTHGITIEDIEGDCNAAGTVDGAPIVQALAYVLATNSTGCKRITFRRVKGRNALKWLIRGNASTMDTNPLEIELDDVELDTAETVVYRVDKASRLRHRNLKVTGSTGHGATIFNSHNVVFDSTCEFYSNGDGGLVLTECFNFDVNSKAYDNGTVIPDGAGIFLSRGCNQFRLIGADARNNGGVNLNIDIADGADTTQLVRCEAIIALNHGIGSVLSEGMRLNRVEGAVVYGNILTDNNWNGIVTNGRSITYDGNLITRNGKWGMNFEDPGALSTGKHRIGLNNHVYGNNLDTGFGEINLAASQDFPNGIHAFGGDPIARPSGVPVTAEGVHQAMLDLGFITA